jgi:hypothetical protein
MGLFNKTTPSNHRGGCRFLGGRTHHRRAAAHFRVAPQSEGGEEQQEAKDDRMGAEGYLFG